MAPKIAKGERKTAADEEGKDVQAGNIQAGKDIADLVRTSLGPRGMDKLLIEPKGDVIITNDGATILNKLTVNHPCAKMLVEVAKAQDVEAGDGTTSVVVLVGALLKMVEELLAQSIHPAKISEAFQLAMIKVEEVLNEMSIPLSLEDKNAMVQAAITSLSSKVVSQYSHALAPMAVDAVRRIYRPPSREDDECNVDLSRIKIVKFPSGTIDDCELVDGMILPQKVSKMAGGPTRIANAKIALIQFQLSPPKTDMENNVVVTDYSQIDRVIREEREYLLKAVKKIKATGCNVLLIQKSILRDAVTETSLQMLKTAKIMVIRDIERADIDFIASSLGCMPIASLNGFKAEKLGTAEKVEEISAGESKYVKFTGLKMASTSNPCVSVLVKGATQLIVDEADRSLHDALCVVRSLHKRRALLPGGGAAEMELAVKLLEFARTKEGVIGHCIKKYAEAFEIVPYTLAENAGLRPVEITTELRNQHANKEHPNKHAGINVRQGKVTDMTKENVIQPLLVTLSAVKLATETVVMILKIDDMLSTR